MESWESHNTNRVVLLIPCDKDPIALLVVHVGMVQSQVKGSSKQLRIEHSRSDYLMMFERSSKLNNILEDTFLLR